MKKDQTITESLTRREFIEKGAVLSAFFIVPRFVLGGPGFVAPSDMINLGFIGLGKQAFGLQKAFLNTGQARIIAACDVYKTKLEAFANQVNTYYSAKAEGKKFKRCATYRDFREMLRNKNIDGVVIATPDHWHAAMAVRAAEAKKDIYCEKPLSLTVKEGRAMVDATRKYKRVFQTGNMQRSWEEFRHAVELIRNGYIGDLKTIKVSVGGPPVPYNLPEEPLPAGLDWKRWLGPNEPVHFNSQLTPSLTDTFWAKWRDYSEFGGGGMTDWGAHMFDIAQWAMDMDGSGPIEVIAPDGNDHPFLTYKYANGVVMTHEDFGKKNAVQFIGTKGQLEIQRGKLVTVPESLQTLKIPESEKHVYKSINHYDDFLNAMRNRSRPISDVEIGHRTATVCNIGNIAYNLKRLLKWDPQTETFENDAQANALLGRSMLKEWAIKM